MSEKTTLKQEAHNSLVGVQESLVGVQKLIEKYMIQRRAEMGIAVADNDAVKLVERVLELFKQLPLSIIDSLPDRELNTIKTQADKMIVWCVQIISFDDNEPDKRMHLTQAIEELEYIYETAFSALYPLISYSMALTDLNQLKEQKIEAAEIIENLRKSAAEQGVSQQASYFKSEADNHKSAADYWRKWTIRMAVAVGCYGVAAMVLHNIWFLTPSNLYEIVQFTVGKLLVFFVLTYMLVLCSKNFLSNRHNEIVNRHRQNALMTYNALADAGGTVEARDVILNHAASAIYKLHDTGYVRSGSSGSSIVEMLPRTSLPLNTGSSSI